MKEFKDQTKNPYRGRRWAVYPTLTARYRYGSSPACPQKLTSSDQKKINVNFSFSSAEKIEDKVLGRLVGFSCHWGISSSHTKHLIISWRQAPGSERLETHHPQGRLGWESSGSGMRQRGRKSFPGGKNRFLEGGLRKILGCYNGLLFTERPSCINR